MKKVVIIGNGIAGTSAARYIRKMSDYEIVMISEETLQPFSRTALMYVYMGHLKTQNTWLYEDWFWNKNRIQRLQTRVEEIDVAQKTLKMRSGGSLHYDILILATGSKYNKFGWPGQELRGVQGLYHLQDLESMGRASSGLQRAVVVGGGLIGIEMTEMFHSRHIPVTMLVREDSFWSSVLPAEESAMVNRHIREHGIDLRLGTQLQHIEEDGTGGVGAAVTTDGERIACGFVGLTVGVSPNIGFLQQSAIETARGVLVDNYLRTSVPDVYAIGDCAQLRQPDSGRKDIEAVWYTGRLMGQTVAHTICGFPKRYEPGIWFNSAKFFDIEYQVYGQIAARPPEGIRAVYWEHPKGKKSIRIQYNTTTQAVTGFNLMGIRYRHEVCEKWIATKTPVQVVLKNLSKANFDPEFFEKYENRLKMDIHGK